MHNNPEPINRNTTAKSNPKVNKKEFVINIDENLPEQRVSLEIDMQEILEQKENNKFGKKIDTQFSATSAQKREFKTTGGSNFNPKNEDFFRITNPYTYNTQNANNINANLSPELTNNTINNTKTGLQNNINFIQSIDKRQETEQTAKDTIKNERLNQDQQTKLLEEWDKTKNNILDQWSFSKSRKEIDSTHPLRKIALKELLRKYNKKYHRHIREILNNAGEVHLPDASDQYENEKNNCLLNTVQKIIKWLREQGIKVEEVIYSLFTEFVMPQIEASFKGIIKSFLKNGGFLSLVAGILGNILDPKDKFFNTKQMIGIGVLIGGLAAAITAAALGVVSLPALPFIITAAMIVGSIGLILDFLGIYTKKDAEKKVGDGPIDLW